MEKKASFLIETMVVLPLLVCFMVFLMFHFRVMQVQMGVEAALQYTSRFMAASAYRDTSGEDADLKDMTAATVLFRTKLTEYECPTEYIALGAWGISLAESEIGENDIALRAVYDMNLPIQVFGIRYYRISQAAVSRKWIGDRDFSDEEQDGIWVYITPTGSAYHRTTACPYLDLSVRSIAGSAVSAERNRSGHIYYACERCAASGAKGTVYITDYGEAYHTSLTCSGLKRTIYMVKRSEVEGRHACAKCG